jgi:hypothetical protein
MEERARDLRAAVGRLGRRGPGRRFPTVLRTQLIGAVRELRVRGESVKRIAAVLGVSKGSVERWSADRRRAKPTALVAVEVETSGVHEAGLTLIGPRGHRVEGLNVRTAAMLLRELL